MPRRSRASSPTPARSPAASPRSPSQPSPIVTCDPATRAASCCLSSDRRPFRGSAHAPVSRTHTPPRPSRRPLGVTRPEAHSDLRLRRFLHARRLRSGHADHSDRSQTRLPGFERRSIAGGSHDRRGRKRIAHATGASNELASGARTPHEQAGSAASTDGRGRSLHTHRVGRKPSEQGFLRRSMLMTSAQQACTAGSGRPAVTRANRTACPLVLGIPWAPAHRE
jgi:hypothetical protein